MKLSRIEKHFPSLYRKLNNQFIRDEFVIEQLKNIPTGANILDAGCGSQRYKKNCSHLSYKAQDFGQYKSDQKKMMGSDGLCVNDEYEYGKLDYVGDIWNIDEKSDAFDAVLCTEVFEHIPFPLETLKELTRLLKPGGVLVLTLPSNCLRHMDPYSFYYGFSDRWLEKFLPENGLEITKMETVGDYYSWMAVEIARTTKIHSVIAKLVLAPAFLYYLLKRKSTQSVDTLCMGYHVLATKVR